MPRTAWHTSAPLAQAHGGPALRPGLPPLLLTAALLAVVLTAVPGYAGGRGAPPAQPAAVLDALHAAASRADGETYFALFTPDAAFLGTDATERWSLAEFRAYAGPFFSGGQGWTYTATERHVATSRGGDVAWFDERLHNDKYGEVRGSGVLVATPAGWRVAQHVLSFPVPNELAEDLVARVRALPAGPDEPR